MGHRIAPDFDLVFPQSRPVAMLLQDRIASVLILESWGYIRRKWGETHTPCRRWTLICCSSLYFTISKSPNDNFVIVGGAVAGVLCLGHAPLLGQLSYVAGAKILGGRRHWVQGGAEHEGLQVPQQDLRRLLPTLQGRRALSHVQAS